MVVSPDIKLPVQEVVVAADVLRQSEELLAGPSEELLAGPSEELLAGPSEELLAGPSEELLAGPSAPPADRPSNDTHHQQEASTSQQAAVISPMTAVNEQPELGLALQQAAERLSVLPDQAASQQTSESEPGSSEVSQTRPHDSTVAVQQVGNTSSASASQKCQTESCSFSEQASVFETAPALSVRQAGGSPGLQQAAHAQKGPSAHHEAQGSISSQQALPSSQASKPFAASHVDSPSAQPEAEHDQQSALTADSEGSAALDREPVSAEQSGISEVVEVVLTPSPATEGHHAPPNNAEDGLTETSKVALEGVTTSSASSKPAASPPVEEEEPAGAVVTGDSSQIMAGPDSSVIASSSPLGVQAINISSMPAKSGQHGAVSSSPVQAPTALRACCTMTVPVQVRWHT